MPSVLYTTGFLREFKKLPIGLQQQVLEKIALFRNDPNHPTLKFHKLKGRLRGYYSFSIDYQNRVVCERDTPSQYALLSVGDHRVYE